MDQRPQANQKKQDPEHMNLENRREKFCVFVMTEGKEYHKITRAVLV